MKRYYKKNNETDCYAFYLAQGHGRNSDRWNKDDKVKVSRLYRKLAHLVDI